MKLIHERGMPEKRSNKQGKRVGTRFPIAAFFLFHAAAFATAQSLRPVEDQTIVVSTGAFERVWSIHQGVLRTVAIRNLKLGKAIETASSTEFSFVLADGRTIDSSELVVTSASSKRDNGVSEAAFELQHRKERDFRVVILASGVEGSQYIVKSMRFRSPTVAARIDIDVIHGGRDFALGGFGQPAFIDDQWYFGVEHPAGATAVEFTNGTVRAYRFIGRNEAEGLRAVVGCRDECDLNVEDGFRRYLDRWMTKAGPQLQYNSWYDLRGKEVTPANLRNRHQELERWLLRPFGLKLDALVIDDGFQEPASIWKVKRDWELALPELRTQVESSGGRLGLWLPLNGHLLKVGYDPSAKLEISDFRKPSYCMAGENYRTALRQAIATLQSAGNFAYFKHDFNFLRCAADGHGHQPTPEAGRDACVEGQLALLDWERRRFGSVVRNLTSDIWLSPWWLGSSEFLWLGGADYGQLRHLPASNPRSAEMTFRDAEFFRRIRIERKQVPPHRLMSHGIIRGKYEAGNLGENERQWAEYVVWFFARGGWLHELYVTPELMPPSFWPILGDAIRWARDNSEVFEWTRMIGDNPEAGEPYGYIHWGARKAIVALRNPSSLPRQMEVNLQSRPGHFLKVGQWRPVVIYPFRRLLPPMRTDRALNLEINSDSILVVELYDELPDCLTPIADRSEPISFRFVATPGGKASLEALDHGFLRGASAIADYRKEKNRIESTFHIHSATAAHAELRVTMQPADALLQTLTIADGKIGTGNHSRQLQGTGWSRSHLDFDVDAGWTHCALKLDLPPTPLFPENAVASAAVRVQLTGTPAGSWELDVGKVPAWPKLVDDRELMAEQVVVPESQLTRRRSAAERWLWIAALTGPISVAAAMLYALAARRLRSRWQRCILLTLVFGTWTLTLGFSPLGAMLARVL